ncbi:MAG: hypothetical protein COB26_03040 [Piscirickettsiaceae bacterium]|nr:MAG: hypothetical protein COB26_03040 [Piscirickettsiaceae bacterium]
MIKLAGTHLIQALTGSRLLDDWDEVDWTIMIRQARRANLISRIQVDTTDAPTKALMHLSNATIVANANTRSVKTEVDDIHRLLQVNNVPFILLKGAAYLYANLDFGKKRVYSDVDIMVRQSDINKAEGLFITNGWMTTKLNAYDQQYYRDRMHELPPLRHIKRQSTLDVHHTIVPPTSAYELDVDKLWGSCQPVDNMEGVSVLSPVDMVLHSAVHLFSDGDFENGIRDLSDITCMLEQFSAENGFWQALVARSSELGLAMPLFYALRYASFFLQLSVPSDVMSECRAVVECGQLKLVVMDAIFEAGLLPKHESCTNSFSAIAMFALFIRSHYLRMPLHQLVPHLLRKTFQKEQE